jgi:hypothetical protein
MSYNFKSLGEVELLNTMPETANVFVEVDGGIRRAPQVKPVDEIAQIVGSETLAEVPEGATVIAEVNGEIKRVHGDQVGGSKTIIFSVIEAAEAAAVSYQTICNYSPAEVGELMLAGASCMLIMPYAVMSARASTLSAVAITPTIVTMQALISAQMDDGGYQFMFFSMGDQAMITYYSDGYIENSLISNGDSPE